CIVGSERCVYESASSVPAAPPSEAELERVATPATVRRAPRYRSFMVAGALVGAVVGLVLALVLADGDAVGGGGGMLPFLDGVSGVRALSTLTGAVVGTFAGGLAAVLADRRSTRARR
ncbi:hypothetical protein AB6N23_13625, partial [Cellulomonas sp. 179-A 9B4 NHS]|uniref:hypothetical protein n=1 Tax=Cellulomonas sp. 179-A 9B4 NHS TaxID=3142379 RepID=UPI0039A32952